jgi:hypothetical protein
MAVELRQQRGSGNCYMKATIWALSGGVAGALLSFVLFRAYCWIHQPSGAGGGLGAAMWAVGAVEFYLFVALPLAICVGAVVGALARR